MAGKPEMKYKERQGNAPFHFYASSVSEWHTGNSLEEVLDYMKKAGMTFNLWYVPLQETAAYQIAMYQPDVEGAVFLGTFERQ